MMESPLIELTRSLYHLDYFRRNFRKLGYHQCGGGGGGIDCLVCCFKNIFHELSLLMRESVLDPPHIRQTIQSSIENAQFGKFKSIGAVPGSVPAHIQFETLLRQLEDCSGSSSPASGLHTAASDGLGLGMGCSNSGLKLHTEFSYTKICLHCRTTSYVESVTQYVMQIDATNFVSDDWPSFEFAIKTTLDAGEFCVQPNCHGQTKVFRLLRNLPHFLPINFSDSTSVSLITFLPTRLRPHLIFESSTSVADLLLKGLILYSPQWGHATIFYHSRLELWVFIDSRRVLTLNKTWIESRFHPITQGFTVVFCFYCRDESSMPSTNTLSYVPPPTIPTKLPTYPSHKQSTYTRIYENWPLDSDSGISSTVSSSSNSTSNSSKCNEIYAKTFEDNSSSGGGSRRNSPTKSPSILSSEGKESSNNFATVRRKVKYHGRTAANKKGALANLSMSAPDLRLLVPPTHIVPPVALSPMSPTNFSDVSSLCGGKPSDRSSTSSGVPKKVSFNCEVTLVDDPDDEYIPHPIFQSILQKLKHEKNGSSC